MQNNIIVQFTESQFRTLVKDCLSESIKENSLIKETDSDKLFSIKEASIYLNLAPQTIYGFTSNRVIPFIKKGKKLYFKKSDLESWLCDGRKATVKELQKGVVAKIQGGKHD